jgi:hypothetical protein
MDEMEGLSDMDLDETDSDEWSILVLNTIEIASR